MDFDPELTAIAVEVEARAGYVRPVSALAANLEAKGWETWLLTLFPFWFEEEFSEDHRRYWDLRWKVFGQIKRGEVVEAADATCMLLLARGLGKSSLVEVGAIMKAAVLGKGYALFVSETDDQATEHLGNCRILIEHPDSKLLQYYPSMAIAENASELKGMPTSDRKEMFITKSGCIFRSKGLTAKMRGLRVGVHRPSHLVFDDIDSVNDSLALSLSKERQITASIIPVQAREGVTIDGAQNLITEHSFFNRVYTGKTDALAERTIIGPTAAFSKLDIETRVDPEGGVKHYIGSGSIASWGGLNIARAQKFLHDSGLDTFRAEYQNEFDAFKAGRVIPEYNADVQRISWSEFEKVFGSRRIPKHWICKAGLDVGYSEGQYPHWSAWNFVATAAANSGYGGLVFVYRSRSFKGTSIDDQAMRVKGDMWEGEHIETWQMSHERTGEMLTLRQKYNLPFRKFQYYKAEDGVAQWRHMSRVDKSKPHPFREDIEVDGVYETGRPTLYYIVDDDQLRLARDDNGMMLLDQQVSNWDYVPVKLTEAGQTVQKPSKVNDDHADCIKSLLALFGPREVPKTQEEQIRELISDEVIEKLSTAQTGADRMSAQICYEFERDLAEQTLGVQDEWTEDWE